MDPVPSDLQALRDSEQRYRALVMAADAIVWTTDADGAFVVPQSSWEAFTGQSWNEHAGTGWAAALHPDDRVDVLANWDKARTERAVYEAEYRLWHAATSTYRTMTARAAPVLNPDGSVREWVGTCADITERRRGEEQLRERTHIAETLYRIGSTLTAELDLHKVVQMVTDEATRLTRAQFGAFFQNMHTEGGQSHQLYALSGVPLEAGARLPMAGNTALLEAAFRGQGVVRLDDVTREPRDGADSPHPGMPPGHLPVRSYLAVPVVSRSGKVIGGLFFGHEEAGVFSERDEHLLIGLAAQAAIAIDNARLYQEALNLSAQLRSHNEELAVADRHKNEFLAMLAHELRNPLAPIRNSIQFLRVRGPQEAELVWAREVIDRQLQQMTRLVDDLLDISRITRGKIQLQKADVDVATVVARAVEVSRPLMESRKHTLNLSMPSRPIRVRADPARLAQVLANLLNNAAKYTPEGGQIGLMVTQEQDEVLVCVRDTGIGIPPDMLTRVFDLFTQVEHTLDRTAGGLGIGLTLVRSLVELHGGSVSATSPGPGQGSAFTVRLPMLPDGAVREAELLPPGPVARAAQHRRVLIVDDNADAVESLALLLEVMDHEVRTAQDGEAALELSRTFQPEVVVLDIGLPGMDGYEVARRLRRDPALGGILLVAMTGYGQEEDRRRSREAGFDHHLVKPVDPDALQQLLAENGR